MNETKAPLYLIDAYGLIYRSYFAFLSRPLRNSAGNNISALFGFSRTLINLLDDGAPARDDAGAPAPGKPLRLAAVFDSRGPTFRHERYAEYKANRQKAPEDLHSQVPLVEEFLSALGVPSLRADRYEADDIIAGLAARCKAEGRQCYILSSDKDLLQLVGDGVYQLRPSKAPNPQSGSAYELVDASAVKAEWGVDPAKVLDLLALIGDSSDNVPGVKGVGEKTAVKLMARYGSLDEIYRNIAGVEGAVGRKLAEGRESAYFSRSLIELAYDAPVDVPSLDALSVERLDRCAGARMLLREGVRQAALALDPRCAEQGSSDAAPRPADSLPAAAPEAGGAAQTPSLFGPQGPEEDQIDPALRGKGNYRTILDPAELAAVLEKGRTQRLLALDFETDSLDAWNARPIGLALALVPGEAYYVPVAAHEGSAPFIAPERVKGLLTGILADQGMTVVAHNAKYDYEVSRAWGLERWKCAVWDTMVAAWVADPERNNYNLDSLVAAHLGLETTPYDSIVPKGACFDAVPLETACRYSAEDADLTLRMKAVLEPKLAASGCLDLFRNLEMPLLPVLAEMEGVGIVLEGDVLRSYGVELGRNIADIEREIYRLVGHEFNIASTKQLQDVLFVERKLRAVKKTKTGYSTDVAVLEELAREDPVPAQILRFRTLSKLKSTYIDTLADQVGPNGRLRTHFVQTGTATGRISSKDPNLQNIPIRDEEGRRIRQAFTAAPGKLLVSADYSQIELVVLAHLSGDAGLCEAFREGRDVHRRTAALIFGLSEEQVAADQRRIAKTINFGVMYGMSAFRLSNELGIPRSDAQAFIDAYFRTYAGIRDFIDRTVRETEVRGYAETILGRRRYIPTINSRNKTEKAAAERVAVNTPIQGSAADIVKLAMLRIDRALSEAASPARLILQVHDELILECPAETAEPLAAMVKREMEGAVALKVPLRVGVETGLRWGDFH